jgi:sulfur carrier protein
MGLCRARIACAVRPSLEVTSKSLGNSRPTIQRHPRASIDATESIEYFEVIALVINGQARSFPSPLNVTGLIEQLELQGKRIALERNGEIVPRSKFGAMELNDGDALEIVVAVGGG